jgi:hypothetical protein
MSAWHGSARPHVPRADRLFFFFSFNFYLASSLPPRVQQQIFPHKTKSTYASQSHTFPPSPPLFLSSRALGQRSPTPCPHHAAAIRSLSYLMLTPSLFNLHHLHPHGRLFYVKRRHSRQLARMYLRPSCRLGLSATVCGTTIPAISANSSFPSHSLSPSVPLPRLDNTPAATDERISSSFSITYYFMSLLSPMVSQQRWTHPTHPSSTPGRCI